MSGQPGASLFSEHFILTMQSRTSVMPVGNVSAYFENKRQEFLRMMAPHVSKVSEAVARLPVRRYPYGSCPWMAPTVPEEESWPLRLIGCEAELAEDEVKLSVLVRRADAEVDLRRLTTELVQAFRVRAPGPAPVDLAPIDGRSPWFRLTAWPRACDGAYAQVLRDVMQRTAAAVQPLLARCCAARPELFPLLPTHQGQVVEVSHGWLQLAVASSRMSEQLHHRLQLVLTSAIAPR